MLNPRASTFETLHLGKKIKEEIKRQGMSVAEFSRRINRTRSVAYDIFKRESIDTELLTQIGKALRIDLFTPFRKEYPLPLDQSLLSEKPGYISKLELELTTLREENRQLKTEVNYLKKIIALLEKGSGKSGKK